MFQVGRSKIQVGVGGKTWKCVLIRVETATKPIEINDVLRCKIERKIPRQDGYFQFKVEISTLVILVKTLSI